MACDTGNIPTSTVEYGRSRRESFSHANSPISPVLPLPSCLFRIYSDCDCRQNQDAHHRDRCFTNTMEDSRDENHAELLGIITESLAVLKQARHTKTGDNNDSDTTSSRISTERKE